MLAACVFRVTPTGQYRLAGSSDGPARHRDPSLAMAGVCSPCRLHSLGPAFLAFQGRRGGGQKPRHGLTQPLLTFYIFLCLYRTDQEIQTYTIAVINALFLKAPDERRQVRCLSLVLRQCPGPAAPGAAAAHPRASCCSALGWPARGHSQIPCGLGGHGQAFVRCPRAVPAIESPFIK